MREIVVYPDSNSLASAAAGRFMAYSREAIAARSIFTVALSGGSTPLPFFKMLAGPAYAGQISWEQTHIFWADERCVPPNDPESNYLLAREALLDRVPVPAGNIHRIWGELAPEKAVVKYRAELDEVLGERDFDLILLGMGSDGHTASLFPGSPLLKETGRRVMTATAVYEDRPAQRVTLTLKAINEARHVVFLVTGEPKAATVKAVLEGLQGALPAQLVRPQGGMLTWMLDSAAASLLRKESGE